MINERTTHLRGRNTCEAPEIAAAILLQVHRRSEELWFSKVSGWPDESNARENAQSRSVDETMSDPVRGREQPQWISKALYIVQKMSDRSMLMAF